jgi:hypothetical protein
VRRLRRDPDPAGSSVLASEPEQSHGRVRRRLVSLVEDLDEVVERTLRRRIGSPGKSASTRASMPHPAVACRMRRRDGREGVNAMKRTLSVVLAAVLVATLTGIALAWGPGMGPRGMGGGAGYGMGPGMMGGGACPGFAANAGAGTDKAVTEDEARKAATEYAAKYFPGYAVERVLPFTGRLATMYRVELKGPKGETRVLHVNPRGNVMPFGPRWEG